jgi:hypothetical protein
MIEGICINKTIITDPNYMQELLDRISRAEQKISADNHTKKEYETYENKTATYDGFHYWQSTINAPINIINKMSVLDHLQELNKSYYIYRFESPILAFDNKSILNYSFEPIILEHKGRSSVVGFKSFDKVDINNDTCLIDCMLEKEYYRLCEECAHLYNFFN